MADNEQNQPNQQPDIKKTFSLKTIRKGILYFVLLSLLSFTILFIYTNTANAAEVIKNLQPSFILLAIFMSFMDMWLGGWRNHIFARIMKPGIAQKVCFKANLANIFMGAVTPSQSGGGAAQLYVWYRSGINLTNGFTISLVNWFSTLLFFPTAALLSLYFMKDQFSENILSFLLKSGFSIFGTLLVVVTIAFWKPIWVGEFIKLLAKWIGKINGNWQEKLAAWGQKSYEAIQNYQISCKELLSKYPWLFPYSFVMTLILYFNKFCLAYVLMLGLGVTAPFWAVIATQVILMFVLYFAPSPGASGIAEFSIAALMSGILAEQLIPVFTLLHRVFLLFIPAMIGAFIVLAELKRHAEE